MPSSSIGPTCGPTGRDATGLGPVVGENYTVLDGIEPNERIVVSGVQKLADARWRAETAEIYRAYESYRPAGGVEQAVFDPVSGAPRRRSEVIFAHVTAHAALPEAGRLLDVGCGAGGMLSAVAQAGGGRWSLYGAEIDARTLPFLTAIAGFRELYTGPIEDIPGSFDVITLVHALEHFTDPVQSVIFQTLVMYAAQNSGVMSRSAFGDLLRRQGAFGEAAIHAPALGFSRRSLRRPAVGYVLVDPVMPAIGGEYGDWPDSGCSSVIGTTRAVP